MKATKRVLSVILCASICASPINAYSYTRSAETGTEIQTEAQIGSETGIETDESIQDMEQAAETSHEKTEDTDSDISALSATAAAGEVGFQFKIKNGMNNVLSDSKYVGYQITSTAPLEVGVYSFSAFITGEIDIPQTVIYDNVEYKVTSILASADWLEATKLVIPEGVTTIEERALKSNDNLAEIDLPASLTSFKTWGFSALNTINLAEGNTIYKVVDGVLFTADMSELVLYPSTYDRAEYTVPDGVLTVREGSFTYNKTLQNLKVANSVSDIEAYTFYQSKGLKNVELGNDLTFIGDHNFYRCENLESLTLRGTYRLENYTICECANLKKITIDGKLLGFSLYDAYDLPSLEEYTVVEGSTKFANAIDGVLYMNVGDKLYLWRYPSAKNLETYVVPDNVVDVQSFAFSKNLKTTKTVILPPSVIVSVSMFDSMETPVSVYFRDKTSVNFAKSAYIFFNCAEGTKIYAPTQSAIDSINNYGKIAYPEQNATVELKGIPATSLTITNEAGLTINNGESAALAAELTPAYSTDDITWTSDNENVATVAADGTVTGKGPGKATIMATAGSFSDSREITVLNPITSVSLDQTSVDMKLNETVKLTASYLPTDTTDPTTVTWSSDNSSFPVDQSGNVTAKANGSATITAKIGDHAAVCKVSASARPITSVTVSGNNTITAGGSTALKAAYKPSNTTESADVTWSSSDASVATVDQNGKVTGVKAGTATITAKIGSCEGTTRVTVKADPNTVKGSLSVTRSGDTLVETFTVTEGNENIKDISFPTWTTADGQDDIEWPSADYQANGVYTVKVSLADHNYEAGAYNTHCYAKLKNSNFINVGMTDTNVTYEESVLTAVPSSDEKTVALSITNLGRAKGVSFAVWGEANGQNDIDWVGASQSGSTWNAKVSISDHREAGVYHVHCYGFIGGRFTCIATSSFTISPVTGTLTVDETATNGMFNVRLSGINAPSGVKNVEFPTWTDQGGQDDIVWYTGVKQSDGSYLAKVDLGEHNFESGTYNIHCYVWTSNGVANRVGATSNDYSMGTKASMVINSDGKTFTETVTGVPDSFKKYPVYAAVWSGENGQNDIRWNRMSVGNGKAVYTGNISDYDGEAGSYNGHCYANVNGRWVALGTASFDVARNAGDVSVGAEDADGNFTITVSNVSALGGVKDVMLPTWRDDDHNDIYWYHAKRQADGSYQVTGNIANHKYHSGTFNTHCYITSENNIFNFTGGTQSELGVNTSETVALNSDETSFTSTVANVPSSLAKYPVYAAVWSAGNGQNDIRWNKMSVKDGKAVYTGKVSDYDGNYGDYNSHCYANVNGNWVFLGAATFTVTGNKANVSVSDVDKNGGFTITISGITSPSGVKNISVPTWRDKNQNDIVWYSAEKQADGTYKVNANIANHKYHTGTFHANCYITANNGVWNNAGMTDKDLTTGVSCKASLGADNNTVTFSISQYPGYADHIYAAVWGGQNGQNDITWDEIDRNSLTARDTVTAHGEKGHYNAHFYARSNDTWIFLGAAEFVVK